MDANQAIIVWRDWSVARAVTEEEDVTMHRYTLSQAIVGAASPEGDTLYGGTGEDWIMAGKGDDFADGGEGDEQKPALYLCDVELGSVNLTFTANDSQWRVCI